MRLGTKTVAYTIYREVDGKRWWYNPIARNGNPWTPRWEDARRWNTHIAVPLARITGGTLGKIERLI